jgi:Zn-dependent protease
VRFLGFPHSRRQDFAITLAGPLSNLAIALAAIVVLVLLPAAQPDMIEIGGRLVPKPYVVPTIAERALRAIVYLNLALCIGNLLPGVPIDGGKLAYLLIEHRWNARVALLVVSALGLFFACLSMLFMLVTTLAGAPAFAPLDFKANIQAFQDARQGRGVWEDYVD